MKWDLDASWGAGARPRGESVGSMVIFRCRWSRRDWSNEGPSSLLMASSSLNCFNLLRYFFAVFAAPKRGFSETILGGVEANLKPSTGDGPARSLGLRELRAFSALIRRLSFALLTRPMTKQKKIRKVSRKIDWQPSAVERGKNQKTEKREKDGGLFLKLTTWGTLSISFIWNEFSKKISIHFF